MTKIKHSVTLQAERCMGCTHCIKRCPTEAIRVRDGKATIKEERCIDCGECIRICPHHAKRAKYDKLEKFSDYKYKIALPAPALYGQFDKLTDIDYIISGLYKCGFDDVFEVAKAAEIVSEYTRDYLKRKNIVKPVISSACPVIVRLISVRFPSLIDNVMPILPPIEVAARMAKKEALEKHPELKAEDICAIFISPCPAKVSYSRMPIGTEKSAVDGVMAISDIYIPLVSAMNDINTPEISTQSGLIGVSWAGSGGESAALMNDKYLAADGIENCIHVLDEIEKENFIGLEFVELNSCNGGCVGGTLTVENPYIAKARLHSLRRYLPVSLNHIDHNAINADIPANINWDSGISYENVSRLDHNRAEAVKKMAKIQSIRESLCGLDCGSCGAPTCLTLAEDIVRGDATIEDCIIRLKNNFTPSGEKTNDNS